MKCPKCKSGARVTDSIRISEHNEVYRRRTCLECGHIFYTAEMEVDHNDQFKKLWNKNKFYQRENKS